MRTPSIIATLAAALTLGACADQPGVVAPTEASAISAQAGESDNLRNGAVYTMTDQITNRVVAYYQRR